MEGRRQLMEGMGPVTGGVHGGLHPSLLQENQYSKGLNITTRGGFVSTRPGFRKLLDLGTGVFQGAGRYRLNEGDRLIFVQEGKIKQIKLFEKPLTVEEYQVQDTTYTRFNGANPSTSGDPPVTTYESVPVTETFSPNFGKAPDGTWSTQVNMAKAERFFIVQDGYHQPAIIPADDAGEYPDTARVSFQSPFAYPGTVVGFPSTAFHYSEVPIGGAISYASRRLVVSPRFEWQDLTGVYPENPTSGRMTFVASDVDIGPGHCLRFIENNFADGGGSLSLPLESGFITAMAPFRNSEAVDGNGALVVFGQDGVCAFNLAFDRRTWGADKQAISQMLFQDTGSYSPKAITPVNDDLYFRRPDGLASLRYTASQAGGSTGSLSISPQSFEVSHRLNLDKFEDLPFVSMDYVDNRLFMTSCGRDPESGGFRGMVVLDGSSLYSMTSAPTPVYDDIWTGLKFLQLVSGRFEGRLTQFMFAQCNGSVGLWCVDPEADSDDGTPVLSRFYTREMNFGSLDIKKFSKVEMWITDLVGEADITVYWRADGYYLWKQCSTVNVNADASGLPQSRYRLTVSPTEENPCDEATGRPLRAGSAFQFCVEWRGSLKLEKVLFFADVETALEPNMRCDDEVATVLAESERSGVLLDDFTYTSCG
jgi:hypothetical protein